jgi:hypothetical protein
MNNKLKFSNFSFILFGETHGYLNDFKVIKRLIKQQKPDYVLYECAEDNNFLTSNDFKNILKQYRISEMTDVKDIKQVLKICYKYHIPIIGIDFKNFGIESPKSVREKNKNKEEPTEKEMKKFMPILLKREQHQIKLIKEYKKKGSILVITGAFHLREDSSFWKELKQGIVIYPTYKNKIIFEPIIKKQRIKYKITKL